jgi:phosphatidylglycerophosphatase A
LVVLCLTGVPLCALGARWLGGKDPQSVVWDEIVSIPITFFLVSAAHLGRPEVLVTGFALNRLFDTWKPPPVRQFERLPAGLGIMADDVMAGVYSCLSLHLLLACHMLPWSGGG